MSDDDFLMSDEEGGVCCFYVTMWGPSNQLEQYSDFIYDDEDDEEMVEDEVNLVCLILHYVLIEILMMSYRIIDTIMQKV